MVGLSPCSTSVYFNVQVDLTRNDNRYREAEPDKLVAEFIKPFVDKFTVPKDEQDDESTRKRYQRSGWDFMLKYGDSHTVRQWFQKLCDYNTSEWLETFSYGTSWYDEALSELIFETINFSAKREDWWCVLGGSQVIAKKMFQTLKKRNAVEWEKRVTKMERPFTTQEKKHEDKKPDEKKAVPDNVKIRVTIQGKESEEEHREYEAVFNSAPLGAMQRMDLRGLNLNWGTKQAIRSLGYGASCKVGIKLSIAGGSKRNPFLSQKAVWGRRICLSETACTHRTTSPKPTPPHPRKRSLASFSALTLGPKKPSGSAHSSKRVLIRNPKMSSELSLSTTWHVYIPRNRMSTTDSTR